MGDVDMAYGKFLSDNKYLLIGIICFIILLIICTVAILATGGIFNSHSLTPSPYYTSPNPMSNPISYSLSGSFLNDTIPANMTPGKRYEVSIITRNTGEAQWSKDNHILLAIAEYTGYDTALFNNSTFTMEPNTSIRNGTNYTWKFTITAPQWVGNYTLAYRMKNDTGYWFGDMFTKTVTVGQPNDSVMFVSQNVQYYPPLTNSLSMKLGTRQNVSITVKNMGRYNWSQANNVQLAAVDYEPNDATRFHPEYIFYIAPEVVIHPGEQCFWRLNLTTPDYPGTYQMKYRMQKGGQWFGNTLNVTVRVV